jgi:hypothetical protein
MAFNLRGSGQPLSQLFSHPKRGGSSGLIGDFRAAEGSRDWPILWKLPFHWGARCCESCVCGGFIVGLP